MLPGAPARLHPSYPLRRALALAHPGELLGAWVRGARTPLPLRAGGRDLLCAGDLGYLLRRCRRVLVRQRAEVFACDADELIAWRTLQIVVGAPYLPRLTALRDLCPELRVGPNRIAVPLGLGRAEPILAACAAARVPVAASWIDYRRPRPTPTS